MSTLQLSSSVGFPAEMNTGLGLADFCFGLS